MISKLENTRIRDSYKVVILSYVIFACLGKLIYYYMFDAFNFHPTATTLINLMEGSVNPDFYDANFVNIARIMKIINIFGLSTFESLDIFFTITLNVIALIILQRNREIIEICNLLQFSFLVLSVTLINAYVFTIAKEPVIFLSFLLIYITIVSDYPSGRAKTGVVALELCLMAIFIKTYYFMAIIQFCFIAFFLEHRGSKKDERKRSYIISILVIVFFCAALYFVIAQGLNRFFPVYYSKFLSTASENFEEASSRITPLFSGNDDVTATLNYFFKIFRLFFPIELLTKGIKYVPYVIVQCLIALYAIRKIVNYNKLSKMDKLFTLVFFSYLLTSAAFEPDFSSWVRHEMAAWPILLGIVHLERKQYAQEPILDE